MSITRIFLYILLAYFLYKFVFNFLVPVIKVSWRVRRQVKEFQRQHQQPQDPLQQQANSTRPTSAGNPTATKPKSGDYIDFEEVKE
jgi:peptidoglycan hydrolase-like protein with peptidoglycan-binding domain